MHFENLLARATAGSSFPADAFVNYGELKRLMALIPAAETSPTSSASLASQLAASSASVAFFSRLLFEVAKVSRYYGKAQTALVAEFELTNDQLRAFCAKYPPGSTSNVAERRNETHALLNTMIRLSSSLIHLENYAVLCYAGFGKALKKHDKNTSEEGTFYFWPGARGYYFTHRIPHILLPLTPLRARRLILRLGDAFGFHASPCEQSSICDIPRRPPDSL
jgi:SPX domain protein involved in polyphosphate accumulation